MTSQQTHFKVLKDGSMAGTSHSYPDLSCTRKNATTPWLQYLKLCHLLYYTLMCLTSTCFHTFPVTPLTTFPTSPFFCALSWRCAVTAQWLLQLSSHCYTPRDLTLHVPSAAGSSASIAVLPTETLDPVQVTLPWCLSLCRSQTSDKQVYEEHLRWFQQSYTAVLLRYLGGAFEVYPVVPFTARPWKVFFSYPG